MSLIDTAVLGLNPAPRFLGTSAPTTPGIIYAFGDSLSDAGNIATLTDGLLPAAPYVDGHFTNGPVWVQDLAAGLGLPAPQPSLRGGTDFAYGGAETGPEPLHSLNPIDLRSQLLQFLIEDPRPQPNALYTLSIGSNDVLDAVAAYPAHPARALADIGTAVANETRFIAALAADGARNFVVLDVPDLGVTPAETAQGAQVAGVAAGLSALYDSELSASLRSLAATGHLSLHLVDTYALLQAGVANPAAFGLTNVTQPLWSGSYDNPASGTLAATGAAQAGYLFFDGLHPTAAGHELLAAAARTSLGAMV